MKLWILRALACALNQSSFLISSTFLIADATAMSESDKPSSGVAAPPRRSLRLGLTGLAANGPRDRWNDSTSTVLSSDDLSTFNVLAKFSPSDALLEGFISEIGAILRLRAAPIKLARGLLSPRCNLSNTDSLDDSVDSSMDADDFGVRKERLFFFLPLTGRYESRLSREAVSAPSERRDLRFSFL